MDLLDNPFKLFPPNVWAMILGSLEDSKDIQNAFKAFAELEWVMSTTRHLWMSDQAVPHLAPWLSKEELLAFRQVCKSWYRAVDNLLENHQSQRPCSSTQEPHLTGQIWIPEAAPRRCKSVSSILTKGAIQKPRQISNILAHFREHPPERNPFVGRSLRICVTHLHRFSLDAYFEAMRELFRKYGHHIWFVEFIDGRSDNQELFESFVQTVRDCITYLPNLKGLRLESGGLIYLFNDSDDEGEEDEDQNAEELEVEEEEQGEGETEKRDDHDLAQPDMHNNSNASHKSDSLCLNHLETLQLDLDFTQLPPSGLGVLEHLIVSSSSQLRRLEIPLLFWKEKYSSLFPNLLELTLSEADENVRKETLINLFLNLNAPKLTTLSLRMCIPTVTETDVMVWLKRFPEIRSFVMKPARLWNRREKGDDVPLPAPSQLVSSLISLQFYYGTVVNHDMLLYFPSLKYLRIAGVPMVVPHSAELNPGEREPTVKMREFIGSRNMYRSNVWELLPKLKTITVANDRFLANRSSTHFTRAMYDHLKKEVNQQ